MRSQEETVKLCKSLFPDSDDVRTLLKICADKAIAREFYNWYTAPARRAATSVSLIDIASTSNDDTCDDEYPDHDVIKLGPDDKGYTYYVDRESNEVIKKTRTVVPVTEPKPMSNDTDETIWYSLIQSISDKYSGLNDMKDRRTFLSDISGVMNKASDRTIKLYHSVLAVLGYIEPETVDAILSARSGTAQSQEKQVVFIESLYGLPLGIRKSINTDVAAVRQTLDECLFNLADTKEAIVEYITMMIHSDMQCIPMPILMIGPPGVGKTSIAKAIAHALNLPYHSFSVGGLSDTAVFRGHHSSWSESTPGNLVRMLVTVQCENPVVLIDEIDKTGSSYHGMVQDIISELCDPTQSRRFVDSYMGFPIDLSKAVWILTANDRNKIPEYLLDRCNVIEIKPYTSEERAVIIEYHLLSQVLKENSLRYEVRLEEEMLKKLSLIPSLREVKRLIRSGIARMLSKIRPGEATVIKLDSSSVEIKGARSKQPIGFIANNK